MDLDESTGSEGRCSSACNSFFEYLRIPLTKMNSGQRMVGFGILGFGMMAQFGRLKSGRFACIPNTRILYGKKGGRKKKLSGSQAKHYSKEIAPYSKSFKYAPLVFPTFE